MTNETIIDAPETGRSLEEFWADLRAEAEFREKKIKAINRKLYREGMFTIYPVSKGTWSFGITFPDGSTETGSGFMRPGDAALAAEEFLYA